MNTIRRSVAALELLLLSPAAFFMAGLVLLRLQPRQYEPTHSVYPVLMWYTGRQWTLWVLLVALPLVVLITGGLALRSWTGGIEARSAARRLLVAIRTNVATLFVAATTLTAGAILAVVAAHILRN